MNRQRDFQNANLRERSFSDAHLAGANFENANLRGVNFSRASLAGANFKDAKIGVPLLWQWILFASLLLFMTVSGLIVSFASALVTLVSSDSPLNGPAETTTRCALAVIFIALMTKKGIGSAFGAWSMTVAGMVPLVIALAQWEEASADRSIAAYIVPEMVIVTLGIAGLVAGAVTGSIIVATVLNKTVLNKTVLNKTKARSIRIISLAMLICVASLGAVFGIVEAIGNTERETFAYLLLIGLTLTAFWVSAYIGHRASQEDPRFRAIQALAIFLTTLKSTQFKAADLTEANFTQVTVSSANFSAANLTRTCWFQSRGLDQALVKGTYLTDAAIRKLVVSGKAQGERFDDKDLSGLNLKNALLCDASFIGANFSNADLQDADLSRAKLAKTQLYNTRLNGACLTGANIQDWAIALDTQFEQVQCDYIYMHLPTQADPDPHRKPDNRAEIFAPGDFVDFIAPIIKTLDLYRRQNVDPRAAATTYKTVDLFHRQGIDPSAAAIALQRLAQQYPDAGLEVVALEGRGNERIRLQARVADHANPSELSQEYFEQYSDIKALAYGDMQALLRGIEEKDSRIRSLESMVNTAIQQKTFYVETYQSMGDTVTRNNAINISAGGDIGSLSGIASGDMSGVANVGSMSGNLTNAVEQPTKETGSTAEPSRSAIEEAIAILFLAAAPTNAARLNLGTELREIEESLKIAKLRDSFELKKKWAVRPADISQALLDEQPRIVHFSGHGTGQGGLCFEDKVGQMQLVSAEALSALFSLVSDQVECVLLTACYSQVQAEAIAQYIKYVIGMSKDIDERAVISFSLGFYQAIGSGTSIEEAYQFGCVQIQLEGIPDHLTPVLVSQTVGATSRR